MSLLETLVVAVMVAVSAAYSAWRLTPVRLHLRVIDALGSLFGGSWLVRLRNRELSKLGGACGGCASQVKLEVHAPGSKR